MRTRDTGAEAGGKAGLELELELLLRLVFALADSKLGLVLEGLDCNC